MSDNANQEPKLSRRNVFGWGPAALAAAAAFSADAEPQSPQKGNHAARNETDPGPKNLPLAAQNQDSVWPPETDSGSVKPFKYSFALSRKRIEAGGWTRQVTVRDLAISKDIAGVEMRLTAG